MFLDTLPRHLLLSCGFQGVPGEPRSSGEVPRLVPAPARSQLPQGDVKVSLWLPLFREKLFPRCPFLLLQPGVQFAVNKMISGDTEPPCAVRAARHSPRAVVVPTAP